MAITYSISGGADATKFNINASTGVLTFKAAPDFEQPGDANGDNVYEVQVKATDAGGASSTKDMQITVKDVSENLPPQITSASAVVVNENQTAVTTVTATDPDDAPPPSGVTHGQQIAIGASANVGRAGAKNAGVAGYTDSMTTISGNQTYSTSQTFRNVTFTGMVLVKGGNVVFEFCSFTAQPPSASSSSGAALQQFNNGAASGTVTCNWCDFDSGLRGSQGNFETEGFHAGQRQNILTNQPATTFTLYRCRIQGYGNGVVVCGWQCSMCYITECYIGECTAGGGSHMDTIEIYGSDNITVQRCRTVGVPNGQCSLANITNDITNVVAFNPIILKDNMVLSKGENAPVLIARNINTQPAKRNVSVTGNYWGDNNHWDFTAQLGGNESPITGLNVTEDKAYFDANQATSTPGLVLWVGNVWTPNGEGVTKHTPGGKVWTADFSDGVRAWTGKVLPDGNVIPPDPPQPSGDRPGPSNTGYKNAPGYQGVLTSGPGSVTSNTTYSFKEFRDGLFIGSKDAPVSNVTFVGCRFVASGDLNCVLFGDNIKFSYCSLEPKGASAPPVSYSQGYQYGIEANGSYYSNVKQLTVENCDIWGFGNAIDINGSTQAKPQVIRNNWIHDCRADGGVDHTDGVGSYSGTGTSSHVVIDNNVIECVANTNGLGYQGGSYSNFTITNNLFSGWGYAIDVHNATANIKFEDNVFSTRLKNDWGPIYGVSRNFWTVTGSTWKRNKWLVPDGAWWGVKAHDGWFWKPVAEARASGSKDDTKYVSQTEVS